MIHFLWLPCSDSGPLSYKPGTHQIASVAGQATVFDSAGRVTKGRFGSLIFDAADHLTGVTLPNGNLDQPYV